jgi:2-C-methyl-D-erythritol 4-phosphate cytidylyltransferase
MSVAVIVVAGGAGSRIGREVNKVYLPIRRRATLTYSLETLEQAPAVAEIVLVVRDEDRASAREAAAAVPITKPLHTVTGGSSRQLSELAGLEAIAPAIESGGIELVAIHDGARPFLTIALLESVLDRARTEGGAIPGLMIDGPVYRREGDRIALLPDGALRRVQTPQAFRAKPLLDAYRRAAEAGFEGADTAETVERFGEVTTVVVTGEPGNLKLTFVEDFFVAEDLALRWERGRWLQAGG